MGAHRGGGKAAGENREQGRTNMKTTKTTVTIAREHNSNVITCAAMIDGTQHSVMVTKKNAYSSDAQPLVEVVDSLVIVLHGVRIIATEDDTREGAWCVMVGGVWQRGRNRHLRLFQSPEAALVAGIDMVRPTTTKLIQWNRSDEGYTTSKCGCYSIEAQWYSSTRPRFYHASFRSNGVSTALGNPDTVSEAKDRCEAHAEELADELATVQQQADKPHPITALNRAMDRASSAALAAGIDMVQPTTTLTDRINARRAAAVSTLREAAAGEDGSRDGLNKVHAMTDAELFNAVSGVEYDPTNMTRDDEMRIIAEFVRRCGDMATTEDTTARLPGVK